MKTDVNPVPVPEQEVPSSSLGDTTNVFNELYIVKTSRKSLCQHSVNDVPQVRADCRVG